MMRYSKKHVISQLLKIRKTLDDKNFIVTKRLLNSLLAEFYEYEGRQEKKAPLKVFYDG